MRRFYFILLTICVLLSGCQNQTNRDAAGKNDFHTIDFVQCMETEQPMLLSGIASSLEYLELKTPEDVVITGISKVVPFSEGLIVCSRREVCHFSMDGQFVRRIGAVGQGPGEYMMASDIEIDNKNKEIIIKDFNSLLFYDFEGKYLRSKQIRGMKLGVSDSVIWIGDFPMFRSKYITYAITRNSADTLANIPYLYYGVESVNDSNSPVAIGLSLFSTMFYCNNGLLYFKGTDSNDTIWEISGTRVEPYARIDMGKYKLPLEYEPLYSNDAFRKFGHEYWGVNSVIEDDRFFYLYSEKRRFEENNKPKYLIYDKKNKKGFTSKDNKDEKITDDIMGGPPVWPRWISDKYYISAIESIELQEQVEAGGYSPSPQLKELLSRIGEDTNQLIVLFHKKN